ncbi:MAG: DUF2723 domain-containing protein [Chloroflexi bacterium]|nr:DUF2723 domain-containing protein [Chloroflexota bacterium]
MFAGALGVFVRTLAPSIAWKNHAADSGDLVAAAYTGGIPHPPGYPLYTALAQLFVLLPVDGIAYRVNLLSALAAAATVLVLYAIIRLVLPADSRYPRGVSVVAALWFAFSPMFWSQATVAEVYALNALLTALGLLGLLLWSGEGTGLGESWRTRGRWIFAAALGLGLAHHLTILFLVPAAGILLWRRVSARAILATAAFALGLAGLLAFSLVLRAWRDPPISWGDPKTLENWWWLVSGQLYRGYAFGLGWAEYPARVSAWARLLFEQFNPVGVALGLWGGLQLVQRSARAGVALGVTMAVYSVFAIGYRSFDSDVYLIPAFLCFAPAIAAGMASVVQAARGRAAFALFLILLPLANLALNFAAMDRSADTQARDYGRRVFDTIPENALVVADGDEHIFALWHSRYVERTDSQVMIVAPGLLSYAWYRDQLRRHNPDWVWPADSELAWDQFLRALVARNLDRHAVFWTAPDPQFERLFRFRAVDALYQVVAAGE